MECLSFLLIHTPAPLLFTFHYNSLFTVLGCCLVLVADRFCVAPVPDAVVSLHDHDHDGHPAAAHAIEVQFTKQLKPV